MHRLTQIGQVVKGEAQIVAGGIVILRDRVGIVDRAIGVVAVCQAEVEKAQRFGLSRGILLLYVKGRDNAEEVPLGVGVVEVAGERVVVVIGIHLVGVEQALVDAPFAVRPVL